MVRVRPFQALVPDQAKAAMVASVPYDVIDGAEARNMAEGNPYSFLHIVRSEIDLPETIDPYDAAVYEKARENLRRFVEDGILTEDRAPTMFLYRQVMGDRSQVGLVACCHIDDYLADVIKKHETTRQDKEDDRTRHVLALNANPEPVFLTYEAQGEITRLMDADASEAPLFDFRADDGVLHTVWRVADPEAYARAFAAVECAYIADGHHRSASAARAGAERRQADPNHTGDEEYNWFMTVLFPHDQLHIMPYNRVVKDLNGLDDDALLDRLARVGALERAAGAKQPPGPGAVCVYLGGSWHTLRFDPARIDRTDPVASLDVALLQSLVLAPILGIDDPRTDKRIDFVGGIRGPDELERLVDGGAAKVAFSMYPTTVEQLMAVSDENVSMPPKSTWFEPKLRSGLFVHMLD